MSESEVTACHSRNENVDVVNDRPLQNCNPTLGALVVLCRRKSCYHFMLYVSEWLFVLWPGWLVVKFTASPQMVPRSRSSRW